MDCKAAFVKVLKGPVSGVAAGSCPSSRPRLVGSGGLRDAGTSLSSSLCKRSRSWWSEVGVDAVGVDQ